MLCECVCARMFSWIILWQHTVCTHLPLLQFTLPADAVNGKQSEWSNRKVTQETFFPVAVESLWLTAFPSRFDDGSASLNELAASRHAAGKLGHPCVCVSSWVQTVLKRVETWRQWGRIAPPQFFKGIVQHFVRDRTFKCVTFHVSDSKQVSSSSLSEKDSYTWEPGFFVANCFEALSLALWTSKIRILMNVFWRCTIVHFRQKRGKTHTLQYSTGLHISIHTSTTSSVGKMDPVCTLKDVHWMNNTPWLPCVCW